MSVRQSAIVAAIAILGLPAAFAQGTFVGGEQGWVDGAAPSSLTATQVRNQYLQFRANPEAPDGGRYLGGEAGFAFPAHSYALKDGHWVCTDKIAHNPKPAAIRSPAEERQFLQMYPA